MKYEWVFLPLVLAVTATMVGCDSPPVPNPLLENGWVTNCVGPEFSRFSQDGKAGPGPERPVFKVNDQLVLAVPAQNRPSAASIDSEPRECKRISDLPSAYFLTFLVKGDWSADYKPDDVPTDDGKKRFLPDLVVARVEPEIPSTVSEEDQKQMNELRERSTRDDSMGTLELAGGLNCFVPKPGLTWFSCSGKQTKDKQDGVRFRYRDYSTTPFILVQADYPSSRYGGIHVYWQVWTSNPPQASEIDAAIWRSIEEWNLENSKDSTKPAG